MGEENKKATSLSISLRKVNILLKRRFESSPIRKELDSGTGMHGYIICYLKDNNTRDLFQKDVEQNFSMRRSTATAILQLMEKNGLIERKAVDYDARLKKIILTERAKQLANLFEEEKRATNEVIESGFTESELEQLYSLLDRVANNLQNNEKTSEDVIDAK